MDPYTVTLHWPDDPDRGTDGPYGPFDDAEAANAWVDECMRAANDGWRLLIGAHYMIAPMTKPFDPTTLWEMGNDAAH